MNPRYYTALRNYCTRYGIDWRFDTIQNPITLVWQVLKVVNELVGDMDELQKAMKDLIESLEGTIESNVIQTLNNWLNDGTLELIINQTLLNDKVDKIKQPINVKDYGAKGDGVTDDTVSIRLAISEMVDGSTLYFPYGDYIVYSDYVETTTSNAYTLDQVLLFKNLKNITVKGDGINSRIRPLNQGTASQLLLYPCILSFDKCENITLKDLTIEGRGESYGNADAGISIPKGDVRTEFTIVNGGSPVLVSRTNGVLIENVVGRFCGSVSVFYLSCYSDATLLNCFANSASLGYGGYCFDTWNDNSYFNYKTKVINCVQNKEERISPDTNTIIGSNLFSGKCGILTEGDSVYKIDIDVTGCVIKDCWGNGAERDLGMGIGNCNAHMRVNDTIVKDCTIGLRTACVYEGGSVVVTGSQFLDCGLHGLYIKENLNISNPITITNSLFTVKGDRTHESTEVSKFSCGIHNKAYTNKKVLIDNTTFICADYIMDVGQRMNIKIINSMLKGMNGIKNYGGENIFINNTIEFDNFGISLDTVKGSSVSDLKVEILNNVFKSTSGLSGYGVFNANGNTNLILPSIIKDNTMVDCVGRKVVVAPQTTKPMKLKVVGKGLLGENTYFDLDFKGNEIPGHKLMYMKDGTFIVSIDAPVTQTVNTARLVFASSRQADLSIDNDYMFYTV